MNPSGPGRPERGPRRSSVVAVVGILFCVLGVAAVILLTYDGPGRDVRETRRFGDLDCVYNVTRDEVEACGP